MNIKRLVGTACGLAGFAFVGFVAPVAGAQAQETFPNGVASGDTTQTTTVLWTRSIVPGDMDFEVSTNPNFQFLTESDVAVVTDDDLLPVKVEITGLTPGTKYFYRATDAAGYSAIGQFTTAYELDTFAGLRFGVSGDWRGELSPYPAIRNADQRQLDFFVELGDTIYADFESPDFPFPDAETLDEYRIKHAEVYGDRSGLNTLADLRASTSILAVIDDHEVTNDFAGGAFDVGLGEFFNESELYENGLQAFQDYNPLRDELYGATADARTEFRRKQYRFNTYGSDAAVFVLDARSFRDEGLPAVADPLNPAQVFPFLFASFDPTRTMLGRAQVEDLKADLQEAQDLGITWKFVLVPEPIQNLGVLFAEDRFEGYAAERTEILSFIDSNAIENVVFVAADVHGTLVNNLTYQNGPGHPQIATSAFEITTGSVAFDAPFGPTVFGLADGLGLIPEPQRSFYPFLARTDKDAIVKAVVNSVITPLGYDPLGLDNNLPIAEGLIDAKLLEGDYFATHTFGWTEFRIKKNTQTLTVTTYGIDPYDEDDLFFDPDAVLDRMPEIVSKFKVEPVL